MLMIVLCKIVIVFGIGSMFPGVYMHKLHCLGKVNSSSICSHFFKLVRGNHIELQVGTQIDLTLFLLTIFQNQQYKCIY